MEMEECKAYGVNRFGTDEQSSAFRQQEESKMPASGNNHTSYMYVSAPKPDITRGDEEGYQNTSASGVASGDAREDEKHIYDVIPTSGNPEHEYEQVTGGAQEPYEM